MLFWSQSIKSCPFHFHSMHLRQTTQNSLPLNPPRTQSQNLHLNFLGLILINNYQDFLLGKNLLDLLNPLKLDNSYTFTHLDIILLIIIIALEHSRNFVSKLQIKIISIFHGQELFLLWLYLYLYQNSNVP